MPAEPRPYGFHQVDVFATRPLKGNPLAVVVGADDLDEDRMARFANWTNLSETTFLLRPTDAEADYRVRIFTPTRELPFAGHPTLGSCHVWLAAGGIPRRADTVVQQCGLGLVRIRRGDGLLSFAAPPCIRTGPVEPAVLDTAVRGLGLSPAAVLGSQWVDNGPGWLGLRLASRAAVLAIKPDYAVLNGQRVGVVGPWSPDRDGDAAQFEVRAITAGYEDPVTGSLNASLAQWLIRDGVAPASYVASQGTVLGREGRVHVQQDGADIWVGGAVTPCVTGTVTL